MDAAAAGQLHVLARLAIAVGIGLFIGLEREYSVVGESSKRAAGIRTHALMGLLGGILGMIAEAGSPAVAVAVVAGFTLLLITTYVVTWQDRHSGGIGITSEVAALLTLVLGIAVYHGMVREAVVAAGAASLILSAKTPLHRFVGALSTQDWVATMKMAVITLVVLPILPNEAYGPYDAFNPFKIWLLVVLISAISFLGYVLIKVIGPGRGLPLTGLIGGLASSTAVTLSMARQSKTRPEQHHAFALATVLACTVMIPRLMLIVAALYAPLLRSLAIPFGIMLLVSLSYSYYLFRRSHRREDAQEGEEGADYQNPFEIMSALKFAVIFAIVIFLVKWVQAAGGGRGGLYLVSALSGLADTDAITVTMTQQLTGTTRALTEQLAVRGITIAVIANSILKGIVATVLGDSKMGRQVLLGMILTAIAGGLVIAFLV